MMILKNQMTAMCELSRFEKPIGFILLFYPCLWGLVLGCDSLLPDFFHVALFFLGSVLMRGAGCTYNDWVDAPLDRLVKRTANRPLAAQRISRSSALAWMFVQLGLSLMVLLALPAHVILWAIGSMGIVALYPWVKRLSSFPQLILGLAFNWGVILGWLTYQPNLTWAPILIYCAGIFWTLAYDTIYALQDIEDDLRIGIQSTAVFFRGRSVFFIQICYLMMCVLLSLGTLSLGWHWIFYVYASLLGLGAWVVCYKINFEKPQDCLAAFKANHYIGFLVLLGLIGSKIWK
jgi:4-hydroxybenzoate polyprenyl transferase